MNSRCIMYDNITDWSGVLMSIFMFLICQEVMSESLTCCHSVIRIQNEKIVKEVSSCVGEAWTEALVKSVFERGG